MLIQGVRARRHAVVAFLLMGALAVSSGCDGEADSGQAGKDSADSTAVASADSTVTDSTAADSAKSAGKKKVPEGVPVKVAAVATGVISDHIEYSATVEAEETIDVYSQASGLVREVLSEEGDKVEAGQVLLRLVDDDLKLAEQDAHVAYLKLTSQFERKKEMYSRKLLSKEEYERQRFDVEQVRIRWERAKLAVEHTAVRSPTDGVVAERKVKLGDRIGVANKLYMLVDMGSLIARVHVPGRDMRNITVKQPAVVTTDFLPGEEFAGHVLRISPVVDPSNGTFKVTLELASGRGKLRPGMFVNAHIVTATHARAVLVPKRAVVYDDGMPHVFVVEDSTATKVQLLKGFEDSDNLEVLSGVVRGDSIVVVGQNGLKDQAKVRVIHGEGLRIPAKPDSASTEEAPKAS